jgi:co-chaperonin GroES (HSP10)
MLGFSKGGVGYVLIKLDNIFEDASEVKGLDERPILVDNTFDKARRVKIYGTVIQTPVSMGNYPIQQISAGFPGYGAIRIYKDHDMDDAHPALYRIGGVNKYKFMHDIVPEVEVGDKIYFKWRILYSANNIIAKAGGTDPEMIVKVPYDHIFCTVRAGQIIPIGGNVLIDPEFETMDDILQPTYYPTVDKTGKKMQRPKEEWIKIKQFPEDKDRQGTIKFVGTPLKGDRQFLAPGMKVIYKNRLRNLASIEGGKYVVLPQSKILAKVI